MLTLTNARLFDGRNYHAGYHSITVENGCVSGIDAPFDPVTEDVVDLQGMTVMPGLITCHLHPDFYRFSLTAGLAGERPGKELPPGVMMAIGVRTCGVLLESGFTGYVGAACAHDIDAQLKIAIAEQIMPGPRIRACGHHIGTTADLNDSPNWWKRYESPGIDLYVDGPEDMRKVVREEIRRGVQTIKIFASAGHGFPGRTVRNMDRDEIAAVTAAAHSRGARVRAHVSDKDMIMECIELGVDVIDHGDEVDQDVVDAMVEAGTFWVPSLVYPKLLMDLGWAEKGTAALFDNVCRWLPVAQQAGVRILIGDDYSGVFRDVVDDDPLDHQVGCYGREFAFYQELTGLAPADLLGWGTTNAGQLLVDAPTCVGVIEPGALADLIVIDGNPLDDLSLLSRPEQYLKAVMRDGKWVIDRLQA